MSNISLPGTPIYTRNIDDTRVVKSEFPKRVRALIMHKKMMINPYLVVMCTIENICIECTLVKYDFEYDGKELFAIGVLNRFILKSDKNILVNRMGSTDTLG